MNELTFKVIMSQDPVTRTMDLAKYTRLTGGKP